MAFWNDPSSIVPKRQYTWVVYFGNRNYNETSAYDRNQLFFGFFKTVSKPSYQLKTTQHKYLGLHEFHYPTHVTWQPVKMTLVDGYIYSFNNKNARYANYVRNEDFIWEDGKLAYKGREAVKRSAQLFFYDALREGGYTDPEEFDADTKLARFRRTVFKNDLIAASIGTNQDFTKRDDGNLINIDTKTWNTIDIVEYSNTFERSGINITNTNPSLYSEVNAEYLKSITEGQEYNRKEKTEEKIKNITGKYLEETKKIREFNNTNVVKQETWKLYNPIITDVNFGDLNYEQDGIVNITLTVSYDWAKLIVEDTVEQTDINKLTKEINLPDKTSATVLQNDIDKELARSLNQRKPLPTVAQNNSFFDKARVLVKQAEAYKSDVSKIDVTKINTTLTDALSTTESELREEFGDVERLATDVSEARRATADALLAVDLGSNYKLVRDEIGKRTDLTEEERNTLLGRLDNTPDVIRQIGQADTQFEEAYDKVSEEVAEVQRRALKLAQSKEFGNSEDYILKQLAISDPSIDTLSEKIGASQAFDEQRKFTVDKFAKEQIGKKPSVTIDELKKQFGSKYLDIPEAEQAIYFSQIEAQIEAEKLENEKRRLSDFLNTPQNQSILPAKSYSPEDIIGRIVEKVEDEKAKAQFYADNEAEIETKAYIQGLEQIYLTRLKSFENNVYPSSKDEQQALTEIRDISLKLKIAKGENPFSKTTTQTSQPQSTIPVVQTSASPTNFTPTEPVSDAIPFKLSSLRLSDDSLQLDLGSTYGKSLIDKTTTSDPIYYEIEGRTITLPDGSTVKVKNEEVLVGALADKIESNTTRIKNEERSLETRKGVYGVTFDNNTLEAIRIDLARQKDLLERLKAAKPVTVQYDFGRLNAALNEIPKITTNGIAEKQQKAIREARERARAAQDKTKK